MSGAALGLALAALAGTRAAAEPEGDRLATPADYAAMTFEPIPNMTAALGTRDEWLENIKSRYATLYLGAATLDRTPEQLAAMAKAEPDATVSLMQCLRELHEKLEAESQVMNTAFLRLMAGACRAGMA